MAVGHYRFSDEVDKLPESKMRHQKFGVHEVQAVIERMDEDSDEELSSRLASLHHDEPQKRKKPGKAASERVEATETDRGDQKKRQLRSSGRREKYREVDSNEEQDDDVEPDDSADFFKQLTTKLKTIATDREIHDSDVADKELQRRKSKLSLKKPGANRSNQGGNDSRDVRAGHVAAKNLQSSQRLTRAGDKDQLMPVKQKSTASQWLGRQDVEDWDRIESLPDSDADEPLNAKSETSDVKSVYDLLKLVDAETPSHTSSVLVAGADKRKQTPVNQLVRPSSRPGKVLKYCTRNETLDAADEISVEEDDSDVTSEDFLSLASGSPAAVSEKGHTPSKKLRGSFWLSSPESRKSANVTDDEFVSNSASWNIRLSLPSCVLLSV